MSFATFGSLKINFVRFRQGSYMLKARASMMNEHVYFFYELRPKDKSRNPD